jgi:Ca2+/H+ antiporter
MFIDDAKKRFYWGVLLAWAPWIPTLFGLASLFRGISREKATGLGAVAGGLAEAFVLWGIVAMLIAQAAAIILLFRSFERGRGMRNFWAAISICLSGLMLCLTTLFLWLSWFQTQQRY